ncbi:MAG: hypothetical protein RLZZ455_57 [Candidatus Parcubacteria bacterium]|jgi:hypothetical protein
MDTKREVFKRRPKEVTVAVDIIIDKDAALARIEPLVVIYDYEVLNAIRSEDQSVAPEVKRFHTQARETAQVRLDLYSSLRSGVQSGRVSLFPDPNLHANDPYFIPRSKLLADDREFVLGMSELMDIIDILIAPRAITTTSEAEKNRTRLNVINRLQKEENVNFMVTPPPQG